MSTENKTIQEMNCLIASIITTLDVKIIEENNTRIFQAMAVALLPVADQPTV